MTSMKKTSAIETLLICVQDTVEVRDSRPVSAGSAPVESSVYFFAGETPRRALAFMTPGMYALPPTFLSSLVAGKRATL